MSFAIVVNFKDGTSQSFTVDTYSHANGALELFNYDGSATHIKLFPFEVLASVDIVQSGV
jgi:hypothetical protein